MTATTTGRRGRVRARALAAAVAAIASSAALAACGTSSVSASSAGDSTAASAPAVSLATSLSTATDSWAIVPMTANPTFWEVFVRPAKSATWKLVTPPAVADNGGLVAAADTGSTLTVAVRPSQSLMFTPLASTADAGTTWSTGGPISAGVAASPGALAVSGSQLAAVLGNGTIEASSDAGSTWRTLAKPGTIADSAAGKQCGTVGVTSVSFGPVPSEVLAAGSCGATGTAGFFEYSPGDGWQRLSLPASGQLVRFSAGTALVRAKAGLTVLWHELDDATVKRGLDRVGAAAGDACGHRVRRAGRGNGNLVRRIVGAAARRAGGDDQRSGAAVAAASPGARPYVGARLRAGQRDRRTGRLRGEADRVAA